MKSNWFAFGRGVFAAGVLGMVQAASATVTVEWATIGDAGNSQDPLRGYGAVDYEYKIGIHEVTIGQYAEFLNAKASSDPYGLYRSNMANYGITQTGSPGEYSYSVNTTLANRPVVYVSWFDAARFCNWMHNGQGGGSTETGAYNLNGAMNGIHLKEATATVWIPSIDEWYKAAYYQGATASYTQYPNVSNYADTTLANYANSVGSATDVGTYAAYPSSYGTFDQGGNVWEWTDGLANGNERDRVRGGSWTTYDEFTGLPAIHAGRYGVLDPGGHAGNVGFRVASIPEPGALLLASLGLLIGGTRRSRTVLARSGG